MGATCNYYKKKNDGPHLYTVYLQFISDKVTDQDGNPWYYYRMLHVVALDKKEAKKKAKQHIKEQNIKCKINSVDLETRGIVV